MPQGQAFADTPLTPDQVKVAAFTDAPIPPPPQGYWEDKGIAGKMWHPPGVAPGQDATAQRVDSNIIGTPSGRGIAPEDALMVGQAGRAIAGAARSGVGAGITEAVTQAAPYVKFTVAKHTLEAAGVPSIIAEPAAYFISGYRRGKPIAEPVTGPVNPAAPHLDRSVPVQPSTLTPQQLQERILYGQGTPPPAVEKPPLGRVRGVRDVIAPDVQPAPPAAAPLDGPAPPAATGDPAAAPPLPPGSAGPPPAPPVTNTLPDQRALNEAALAARRAAYQARVQAAAEADAVAQTPAPARLKLTAPESKEYLRLRQGGMTDPQTMEALQAARDFQQRFGTPTPTVAETRFPKGGGR